MSRRKDGNSASKDEDCDQSGGAQDQVKDHRRNRSSKGINGSKGRSDSAKRVEDNAEDGMENTGNEEENTMEVRRKGGSRYRRESDRLPFDVKVSSPPPRYLGRFRLDALTHGGDVLEHEGQSYVVKSVVFHYVMQNGKFVVNRKTVHVKSLARKSLDSYLNKLYKNS